MIRKTAGLLLLLPLALLMLPSPEREAAAVFRALDAGDVPALASHDTDALIAIIKRGRPSRSGRTGEFATTIADSLGRMGEVILKVPKNPTGVLIVLHGLGGTSEQFKDLYKDFAKRENLIIVAPTTLGEPEGRENEDFVKGVSEVLPPWWSCREDNPALAALSLIKRQYSIDENRVFLSGYSMGGFGAWNIGLRYPDRFAAVVPWAGGLSRLEYKKSAGDPVVRPLLGNASNLPLYFIHGDADFIVPVGFDRKSRDRLRELGYDFSYVEVAGAGHGLDISESGLLMRNLEEWLAPKRRQPHPREVKHFFIGDYCPQAYWVRVIRFSERSAEIRAKVEGQKIDFTSRGASEIAFYIDEALLDIAKPIRVTSGDKTLFEGRVKPSVEVILESWRAREDRDLVFRAKITVSIVNSPGE